MSDTSTPAPSIDRVVAAYFKIKTQRDAFRRHADEIDKEFERRLDALENHCLGYLNRTKQDSLQASGGTVYRHKDITPNASDWSSIYRWIEKEGAWDMLERRIKKTFISEYMDTHKGDIPPGVSVRTTYQAKIRRLPRKKGELPHDDE